MRPRIPFRERGLSRKNHIQIIKLQSLDDTSYIIIPHPKEDIILIEDISDFVKEQHQFVLNDDLENLIIPEEKPLLFDDEYLNKKLRLN